MKYINIAVSDERYQVLQELASAANCTVETLVENHIWEQADKSTPASVIRSRVYIQQAINKAKAYEAGKVFTAKDIMPEDVDSSQLHGYSRHIHGALQRDPAFTRITVPSNPLISYRRN